MMDPLCAPPAASPLLRIRTALLAALCIALLGHGVTLAADTFTHRTRFYELTLQRDPARVLALNWDRAGTGHYTPGFIERFGTTQWVSTLFIGQGFFTDTPAGDAAQLDTSTPGRVVLRDIHVTGGLTADWSFDLYENSIEYAITWKAALALPSFYDLGHQWVTTRLPRANDEISTRSGDAAGFGVYSQLYDEAQVVRFTPIAGSTTLRANRYFSGVGIVWQNLWSGGSATLAAGNHAGGRWRISQAPFSSTDLSGDDASLGRFEEPGKYLKDFFFFRHAGLWHLFYNVGTAGFAQDWQDAGNEEAFGHASSPDLVNWSVHPTVLPIVPNTWQGKVVSAPSIVETSGTFRMMYTGFDNRVFGLQSIGLATSSDLFAWTSYAGNPRYTGAAWTDWNATRWSDCRDPHILAIGDHYLMYSMVRGLDGLGAVAIARSDDGINWSDRGWAMKAAAGATPESPVVFERNGKYYLITTSTAPALYVSSDPEANDWTQLPFEFPEPGFWSGFEVQRDGDRWIAAAFKWNAYGNAIRFWELAWDGDRPYVVYRAASQAGCRDWAQLD